MKWFLIPLTVLLLLTGCSRSSGIDQPLADKGQIDLSTWNFNKNPIVKLDGDWEIYWDQLLTPETVNNTPPSGLLKLPCYWEGKDLNGNALPATGSATFRLKVKTKHIPSTSYSLELPKITSSYQLWVNDHLVSSAGVTATSKEKSKSEYKPMVVAIPHMQDNIEILLQISNYDYRHGGFNTSIRIGETDVLVSKQLRGMAYDMLLFGALVIMGLYHLGLYVLRRKDLSPLYFGLFSLLIGIHILTGENYMLSHLFPELSWEAGMKIKFLCICLSVPMILNFLTLLLPYEVTKKSMMFFGSVGLLFCTIVLFTPISIYSHLALAIYVWIFLSCAYIFYCVYHALKMRRLGANLVAVGTIAYVLTVINDILYYNELAKFGGMSPYGLLFCVMIHAFYISLVNSNTFHSTEEMSVQLKELNNSLEQKIEERTMELVQTNARLEQSYAILAREEGARRQLLTNISHDLRTPITMIQGYLEALLDRVVENPEQQRRYLQLIHTKTTGLNRLIHDLFELSKLEARQTTFTFKTMDLNQLMQYFQERYELEIREAGLDYKSELMELQAGNHWHLNVDLGRIDQVFTNIIYNSFRHTPQGGLIRIHFDSDGSDLVISIHDNGVGIAEEDLPFIFDRFFKNDKSRNSMSGGSGLGLAIAKEIVENHGGRIGAYSKYNQGTTIWFTLPLQPISYLEAAAADLKIEGV